MTRLAILFALLLGCTGAAAQQGTVCDRPRVDGAPDMVMLLWRGPTEVENGFADYLDANGIKINVTCLSADSDSSNLPEMVARARELAPDLVYTWGTGVTLAAVGRYDQRDPASHISDRPVIFTMVSYPVEAGIVPSFDEPSGNVTGSSHTVPLGAQLRAMQSYRPVSSIGVLYNPLEPNSVINVQALTEAAAEDGIEVVALPVEFDAAGAPDAASLPGLVGRLAASEPQFLFIGPDSFIGEHRETVIGEALRLGIPTFTGTELEISSGRAMVGLVTSYYNLGRYMGSLAERILFGGEDPSEIPVRTLSRFTYMVRLPVARELGLYPPLQILDYADVILEPVE